MRLFIPQIGTPLRLENDWTFMLFCEDRNAVLWRALSPNDPKPTGQHYDWLIGDECHVDNDYSRELKHLPVTLPAGTLLTVDRLYIRKGGDAFSNFDSITFNINETTHPTLKDLKRKRFWAKLSDVNTMDAELVWKEEKTLRAIVTVPPKANIQKTIEWLGFNRFEIEGELKNKRDIIVRGPQKRFENLFGEKITLKRGEGYVWKNLPTRHPHLVESVSFGDSHLVK